MKKVLESKRTIRFQDCDPFNHLNNARYLDYFINAREDQLIEEYDLDVFKLAATEGKSWVIASNQIVYFKPALLMEEVLIATQLIDFTEKSLLVEMRMWDEEKTHMKALLWVRFTHFDLKNLRTLSHMKHFGTLFSEVKLPVDETTFEERSKKIVRSRHLDSV